MDQQRTAVISQPQVRRVSRIIDIGSAYLAQFHPPAAGSDEQVSIARRLRVECFALDRRETKPEARTGKAVVFVEVDVGSRIRRPRPDHGRVRERQTKIQTAATG